jgi:hypothetical protein
MAFTATAATTTLSFVGASGVNYIGLDNVSVVATATPVSEPATLALMIASLSALGYVSRRRPSQV